jgi:hypothetical protein
MVTVKRRFEQGKEINMSFVADAVSSVFGGGPSAPAAPDYAGAAEATAKANLDAARAATAANRVNQVTPYGNVNYEQTGTDQYGNPTWTATQTPTSALQGAIDKSTSAVANYDYSKFDPNVNPLNTSVDPSVIGMEGWDKATNAILQRLNPTIQRQNEMSDQQLANQGIMPGSQAYNVAKQQMAEQQNDLLTQASLGGAQVQNQMYNQALSNAQLGNQASQIGFNQQRNVYDTNLASPFTYASNVKALATPNYVNPTNQPVTAGADILGATTAKGNFDMSNYNAEQARNANLTSGLMNLGGAAILASDIRLKENIVEVGVSKIGLPVYIYEYKPEWKNEAGHGKFMGYMAHEVEKFMPEAVITRPDGYKMVNYGALNG